MTHRIPFFALLFVLASVANTPLLSQSSCYTHTSLGGLASTLYPSPPYPNCIDFIGSTSDSLWFTSDISWQAGYGKSIWQNVDLINPAGPSSNQPTATWIGYSSDLNHYQHRTVYIQNLSLQNVTFEPIVSMVLNASGIGGGSATLTLDNATLNLGSMPNRGVPSIIADRFYINATNGNSTIYEWTGRVEAPTTLTVSGGSTLKFDYCGSLHPNSPTQTMYFSSRGNLFDIYGTMILHYSTMTVLTTTYPDRSTGVFVRPGGTLELLGSSSSLTTREFNMGQGATLLLTNNTTVKSTYGSASNSTVLVGNGGSLKVDQGFTFAGTNAIRTTVSSDDTIYSVDLVGGSLYDSSTTVNLSGTGTMRIGDLGISFNGGTFNVLENSRLLFSSNSLYPQIFDSGTVNVSPNARVQIGSGYSVELQSGFGFTNDGRLLVDGSFRGQGTISGSGNVVVNPRGEFSVLGGASSTLSLPGNSLMLEAGSRTSLLMNPGTATSQHLDVGRGLFLNALSILDLSVTNDVLLPLGVQFLLMDYTNTLAANQYFRTSGNQALTNGAVFGVGMNLYEIHYNDTTFLSSTYSNAITLNSYGVIYDSYWATNASGNWTNNPYWGTLGTNVGVAPGLDGAYRGWDTATFDQRGLLSGTGTVTLNTNAQISDIFLNTTNATYVIGGSGTITMGTGYPDPTINVAGTHRVDVTLNLVTNVEIAVTPGSQVTVGGAVIGTGGIEMLGGGTAILSGNNSYTGGTIVGGGTLLLNCFHTGGGAYSVNAGGVLGGTGGTTSMVSVNRGGAITPGVGNTPGTLSVGSLQINTGGTFNVLIASTTQVGQVQATGTALIGGTLNANPVNGWNMNFGDRYQILTAGGGISGTFGTIAVPQGYRGRFLVENGGRTGVLLIAPQSYIPFAATPNQQKVASALNTFIPATNGDKLVVSTALDGLTTPQSYQQAFNAISPQFYQSLSTIAFNLVNAQYNDLVQQMFGLRVAGTGFSMSGFADNTAMIQEGQGDGDKNPKNDVLRPGADTRWGMFVDGNGIFAQANSGNMLPGYNAQSGGLITGLTYKWSPEFTTGIYAGYEGSYGKYSGYNSGSTVIDNTVRFGLLGTYGQRDGKGFYWDALIGGSYNNYSVTRAITFPGINRTANSSPGAGELDSMIAVGYNWRKGNWSFGPVSSLQYTYYGMNSFSETGAQSLDLQGLGWNTASMIYNLGGNCAYAWQANRDLMVVPQINLAWQHEFLQNPYAINGTMGGAGISSTSATPLRDTLYTGVGVTLEWRKRWNTAFFYNAAAGNRDIVSQNIFWSAGVKF